MTCLEQQAAILNLNQVGLGWLCFTNMSLRSVKSDLETKADLEATEEFALNCAFWLMSSYKHQTQNDKAVESLTGWYRFSPNPQPTLLCIQSACSATHLFS